MSIVYIIALVSAALLFAWLHFREQKRGSEYLERAQLAQQEKLVVVEFMHDMVKALGEGLGKEELFQRIVHASVVSTGALSACVYEKTSEGMMRSVAVEGLFPPQRPLRESDGERFMTRAKYFEQALRSEEFPVGEGVVGEVAATGRAALVKSARDDSRIAQHVDPALVIRTTICAPISFQGKVLGVLAVCNTADGLPFSETDKSVIESLGEQAGIAIHNNEFITLQLERKQIDADLRIARRVQQMMVPRELPFYEGAQIDGRYISSHSVGGDLYDVIELGRRKFGVVVADVSGKGIPGSILMAICRTHMRQFAREELGPAEALRRVNAAMIKEVGDDMYITVLYAIFDLEHGDVTYARAGHERPLICRLKDGSDTVSVDYPDSEGMPIGLVHEALFDDVIEEVSLPFNKGDIFVAYTDGLTESRNALDREYSAARLADAVRNRRNEDAKELNEGILSSVRRFSGKSHYEDDLTLVTVKRVYTTCKKI